MSHGVDCDWTLRGGTGVEAVTGDAGDGTGVAAGCALKLTVGPERLCWACEFWGARMMSAPGVPCPRMLPLAVVGAWPRTVEVVLPTAGGVGDAVEVDAVGAAGVEGCAARMVGAGDSIRIGATRPGPP